MSTTNFDDLWKWLHNESFYRVAFYDDEGKINPTSWTATYQVFKERYPYYQHSARRYYLWLRDDTHYFPFVRNTNIVVSWVTLYQRYVNDRRFQGPMRPVRGSFGEPLIEFLWDDYDKDLYDG